MPTATRAERIDIDDIPLTTAAWETLDLSPLFDIPDTAGTPLLVPYRRGVVPFKRSPRGKRLALPIAIYGDADSDGAPPAGTDRAQLWANRNELVATVLSPIAIGTPGTRTLRYRAPDGVNLVGPCQIIGGLRPTPIGPTSLRASLELILTEGGLRAEAGNESTATSAEVAGGATDTVDIANPGTDYQDTTVLTLTGTATAVTLTNLTADPSGGVSLTFGGSLGTGVVINTGAWTAVRDSVSVVGLVDFDGFERWLPLVPGVNTIEIAPTAGTATLDISHLPFYA